MKIDLLKLPSPCRSGRFCETCRSRALGAEFRSTHQRTHPEMFGPGITCMQGLDWDYLGMAPWAQDFADMVRSQARSAAMDAAAASPAFGPGDVVKLVLVKLGYRIGPKCPCPEFQKQMNEWGWRGCWKHRDEIVQWFLARADEQGIRTDQQTIWGLVRAGLKDLLRRRALARHPRKTDS